MTKLFTREKYEQLIYPEGVPEPRPYPGVDKHDTQVYTGVVQPYLCHDHTEEDWPQVSKVLKEEG